MSKIKQPADQPLLSDNSVEEGAVDVVDNADAVANKPIKGKKKPAINNGYQALRANLKDPHKGPKIGNAPRGTRRTMGKR